MDAYSDDGLLRYIQEQLGPPYYRKLNEIANEDFRKPNGGVLPMQMLQKKLQFLVPGKEIEYKSCGVLVFHDIEEDEEPEEEEVIE